MDFLHSRLAPPKENRFGSTAVWGTIAAIVLVAVGGWMFWDMHQRQAQVDKVEKWLDEQSVFDQDRPELTRRADGTGRAAGSTRGTPVLDCMKNITQAFPTDGSVIRDEFFAAGKMERDCSRDALPLIRSPVWRFVIGWMGDKRFVDVTLIDMRDAGGNSRDVVFTIAVYVRGGKII